MENQFIDIKQDFRDLKKDLKQDLNEIKAEIFIIHQKVDKLWGFRAFLLGAALATSTIASFVLHVLIK